MITPKYYLVLEVLAFTSLLLSACGASTPAPQAVNSGPPVMKPIMVTITMPANGICPPGYHSKGPVEFPYCELDPTPSPTLPPQAVNSGPSDSKPGVHVVQYCANKGANLGGVNISFALDNTLHVEDWFSQDPGQVACADDSGNPRTCWGPESESFEVTLCNNEFGQNNDYQCQTLPVTLGTCNQSRAGSDEQDSGEGDNQPPPIPPCVHC